MTTELSNFRSLQSQRSHNKLGLQCLLYIVTPTMRDKIILHINWASAWLTKILCQHLIGQNICQALYPLREMRLHRRDVSLSTDWSARTPLFCVRPSALPSARPTGASSPRPSVRPSVRATAKARRRTQPMATNPLYIDRTQRRM